MTVRVAGFASERLEMPRGKAVPGKAHKGGEKSGAQSVRALRSQVVAPKTESRYLVAVSRFLTFLLSHSKPYPTNFFSLDREVSCFIEELWEDGEKHMPVTPSAPGALHTTGQASSDFKLAPSRGLGSFGTSCQSTPIHSCFDLCPRPVGVRSGMERHGCPVRSGLPHIRAVRRVVLC